MIKRTLQRKLLELKKQFPILALFGPRQSGKTTLARTLFPHYRYVNLESFEDQEFAQTDGKGFLDRFKEEPGIILDEIQKAPKLLSYIQIEVDENPRLGRFILTGSQNILLNQHVSQTLAGRVALTTLLPLSIEELREAGLLPETAEKAIFHGFYPRAYNLSFGLGSSESTGIIDEFSCPAPQIIAEGAIFKWRGKKNRDEAVDSEGIKPRTQVYNQPIDPVIFAESYVRTYIERDVRDIKQITSLAEFQKFMRLCAGRIGQLLNLSSLATEAGISLSTVKSWLSVLEASYILFFLQPYHVNFNKRLVKMPKLYFYDTSLACNLLRITHSDDVYDHYLRGGLFESMILSDLLKQRYHNGLPPNAYFWRDKVGNEIDCILEEGSFLKAIEIKSSATINPAMFDGLTKWAELAKIPPEKRIVIYGGNEEQKRKQGTVLSWRSL